MAYKAIDVISIIIRFSVFGWETSFPRKIISHRKTDNEKNKEKRQRYLRCLGFTW